MSALVQKIRCVPDRLGFAREWPDFTPRTDQVGGGARNYAHGPHLHISDEDMEYQSSVHVHLPVATLRALL